MKKTKQFNPLWSLMLLLMAMLVPQGAWALGGSGTSASPYTIANAADLVAFASKVNGTEQGAYAKLTADITLTSTWTAMGTSSKPYTGTFDGQGHTISGLNLTATTANAGLFGYVNGATIKNFSLAGSVSSNSDNVGSVVGSADGATKIYNVYSSVNIKMTAAKNHIGGIAGQLLQESGKIPEIKGCTYSGTMNLGNSTDSNGGIVGYCEKEANVQIEYCFFSGSISSSGSTPRIGGILGYADDENSQNFNYIRNCFCDGTLSPSSGTYVGAIAGYPRGNVPGVITNNTYKSGMATNALGNDKTSSTTKAITISVTAGTGGSVSHSYANPTTAAATQLQVVATPNAHYHLGSWSDSGAQTHNVGLTESVSLTASFAIDQHTITVKTNNSDYGTVTGGGTYDWNSNQTIKATAKTHYHFVKWSDNNTDASHTITVTGDATYTATFAPNQYTITVATNNSNYGTVSGGGTFDYNSTKTITATPKAHYHFVQWNDGVKTASRQITVTGNTTYTATFAIDQHTITVQANNDDYGTVTGGGTYNYGTQHTITATPKSGHLFVQWNDGNTNASRTITVNSNATYTATFNPIEAKAVFNNGTLTFYYDGINHDGTTYAVTGNPDWKTETITSVVFDASFAAARPTSCSRWFYNQSNLQSITSLQYLNTSEVEYMHHMFYGCSNLTSLDLSNFNTAQVTDMNDMFSGCSKLTSLDLSSFNTESVTRMDYMFDACTRLASLTIGNFDMQSVTNTDYMFRSCYALNTLTMKSVPFLKSQTFNTRFYGDGKTVNLVLDENSVIHEGTNYLPTITSCNHYQQTTPVHVDATCTEDGYDAKICSYCHNEFDKVVSNAPGHQWGDDHTCTVCHQAAEIAHTGTCGTCTWSIYEDGLMIIEPTMGETGTLAKWNDYVAVPWHDYRRDIKSIQFKGKVIAQTCDYMFYECRNLKTIDFTIFDTKDIVSMNGMFAGCSSLQTLDLSGFNTANVTDMNGMFTGCSSLQTLDLSGFNTANVTNMGVMFDRCSSLQSLDLSGFNTANVGDMSNMFNSCSSLQSLDLSGFNTANVGDMSYMFFDCSSLQSLDLSSFNTANVEFMTSMFYECTCLATLKLSNDFVLNKGVNKTDLFRYCGEYTGQLLIYYVIDVSIQMALQSRTTAVSHFDKAEFVPSAIVKDGVPFNSMNEPGRNMYIPAENVVFTRTFTPNKPATITLPFKVYANNVTNAKFYGFTSLDYNDATCKWEANMDCVKDDFIQAYTPYMILTEAESIDFGNENVQFIKTPAELNNTTQGDWTFVALNETKTWEEGDPELGRAFLVTEESNTNADDNGSLNIELVKIEAGTTLKAGRCYFLMNEMPTIEGDVNNDGCVSIADLTLLIEILNGRATDTTGKADVDRKNGVTIDDIETLKTIILSTDDDSVSQPQ